MNEAIKPRLCSLSAMVSGNEVLSRHPLSSPFMWKEETEKEHVIDALLTLRNNSGHTRSEAPEAIISQIDPVLFEG